MLWVVPIEPIEYRYSADWLRWFREEWPDAGFIVAEPMYDDHEIRSGQFLDVFATNHYKAEQVKRLAVLLAEGVIKDGDSLLFLDGWFPLEQVFYMLDLARISVKVTVIMHAGSYDTNDLLYQRGFAEWARHVETGWFKRVDSVIVFSEYHARLLCERRDLARHKVHVCAFPYRLSALDKYKQVDPKRRNSIFEVVFPHRKAPEKSPELAARLRAANINVVETHGQPKSVMYDVMSRSRFVVSWNWQETFGIAVLEATYLGAEPLLPNRLSYPELYSHSSIVRSVDEMIERIVAARNPECYRCPAWAHPVIVACSAFSPAAKAIRKIAES